MKIEYTEERIKSVMDGLITSNIDIEDMIAIDYALKKQILKKPEYRVDTRYPALGKDYWCNCGVMLIHWESMPTNYCGNCGQRLK